MKNKTKKIGIITLPLIDNYGGMLQHIALYSFLSQNGYEVIPFRNHTFRPWYKRLIYRFLEKIPFQNIKNARYVCKKRKFHNILLDKILKKRTEPIREIKTLKKIVENNNFDAIIVGSDQVWRWAYTQDYYKRYYLDFIAKNDVKKISYAASFGVASWESSDQRDVVRDLLKNFDAISVREKDGVDLCHSLGFENISHVIDPTLLMEECFYIKNFLKSNNSFSDDIFLTYILDENELVNKFISNLRREKFQKYKIDNIGLRSDMSISDWISKFYYSEFVVTDSFHGMVFSIIFNKNFYVIVNESRGSSRFYSLLSMLGLESRLVNLKSGNLFSNSDISINYDLVNKKIDFLKKLSANFLIDSIES